MLRTALRALGLCLILVPAASHATDLVVRPAPVASASDVDALAKRKSLALSRMRIAAKSDHGGNARLALLGQAIAMMGEGEPDAVKSLRASKSASLPKDVRAAVRRLAKADAAVDRFTVALVSKGKPIDLDPEYGGFPAAVPQPTVEQASN